ncbi:MAG TPA: phosphate signaling complex protein PhoU [Acidobacteriota bacterium]
MKHIDELMEELNRMMLRMAGLAEAILQKAYTAYVHRDPRLADEVFADDLELDRMELQIDQQCVRVLALQQPAAVDLRFIVACLRLNNDLERIGDHCKNIASRARRLSEHAPMEGVVDMAHLVGQVSDMLHKALNAFTRRDAALAQEVLVMDDQVDASEAAVIVRALDYMAGKPSFISQAVDQILIAKNLERIGDIASNLAEEVVFIVRAETVKHPRIHGPDTSHP